jgi:hypothetical protein
MKDMKELLNVTLIALTSVRIPETIKALEYSCKGIKFGSVKLASDIKPENLPDFITHEYTEKSSSIDEWNYNIIYNLPKHIDTEYCILIHDNGFIVNPESWRDEFLNYDYIGAPWPLPNDSFSYRDIKGEVIRQGNSVSLRSKKLLDIPNNLKLEWKPFHGYTNEDGFICVNYRHRYLEEGCLFADIDVAKYFSHESMIPEIQGIKPFAFHNYLGTNNQYPKF